MPGPAVVAVFLLALSQVSTGPSALDRGLAALAAGDLEAAESDLKAAVATLEATAQPAITIARAELHLAHAQFRLGRRDHARATLAAALARAPDLTLDPTLFPRGLLRLFESVRSGGRWSAEEIADPAARAARLVPLLRHENELLREAAHDDLVDAGPAALPILEFALREQDPRLRRAVLEVLADMDRLGDPAVLAVVGAPKEPSEMKKATISGLALGRTLPVARVLASLLLERDVRAQAVAALAEVLPRLRGEVTLSHASPGCFVEHRFPKLVAEGRGLDLAYTRIVFKGGPDADWYEIAATAGKVAEVFLPRPTLGATPVSYYLEALALDPALFEKLDPQAAKRLADLNVLARTSETIVAVIRTGGACPGGLAVGPSTDRHPREHASLRRLRQR